MRHSLARFVVALGLALAAAGPARASTPWAWQAKVTDVGPFDPTTIGGKSVYVGLYTLAVNDWKTIAPTAAPCANYSKNIGVDQWWSARPVALDASLFNQNSSTFVSTWSDSGRTTGLISDNLKKAAWLNTNLYTYNSVAGNNLQVTTAIQEAIWSLVDVGFDKSIASTGTANNTQAGFWLNLANQQNYVDKTSQAYFDWTSWSVLMPYELNAGADSSVATNWTPTEYTDPWNPIDRYRSNSQVFIVQGGGGDQEIPGTPEPGSMALLLVGMGLFGLQRRRSRSVVA